MKLSGPILKNIDSKILSSLQEIAPRVAKKDINIWGNKS